MTKPLSPAALAVLNAAEAVSKFGKATPLMKTRLSAALRAAADQVVPDKCPPIEDFNEFDQGYAAAHITHRAELLAIAAELESQ